MKHNILILVLGLALVLPGDSLSQRGGGRGGGGRGGGGGGARAGGGANRTPSFSGGGGGGRQQPAAPSRPSGGRGGMVPSQRPAQGAGARPGGAGGGGSRGGLAGAGRPSTLPARPGNVAGNRPGIGDRPGVGNRPGGVGGVGSVGNRPGIDNRPGGGVGGIGNRPGIDNRPGGIGGVGNRPGIDNRPGGVGGVGGIGNRPGIDNRPGGVGGVGGIGNRPGIDNRLGGVGGVGGIGNRPGIDNRLGGVGGVGGIGNRVNIGNRANIGEINANRATQINAAQINGGYNYYQNYHSGWHRGYWNNWYRSPLPWAGAGAAVGWMAAPGPTYAYSNPYYEESWAPSVAALDYSQPISVPTVNTTVLAASEDVSTAPAPPESQEPAIPKEALERFDAARAAFKQGDYASAQKLVEQAIELLPQDATLHEFRALTLFAQKQYQEAAAAVYAVLSAGPGWTWETLAPMYPNSATYTEQLRALESYVSANPKSSAARFLLAYHYLVVDEPPEAVKQLQTVVKLSPDDQLAKQLLQAFSKPDTETPKPSAPG